MHFETQKQFAKGRFLVERELGRGGMGVVYEAFDREQNMRVALKTLLNMNPDNLYYFKREFRALHDFVHPNLCSFMELIQDDDGWFLTMELIQGDDFLSYIKDFEPGNKSISSVIRNQIVLERMKNRIKSGKESGWEDLIEKPIFDERRLRKSLAGLCEGLGALHAAGKIHRDIKPSNVMITEDDRVVLLDFGLITEKEIQRQTELGAIVGTAAYMAPEQAQSQSVGPAADWYSVGVMLYEVLTGKLPFDGPSLNIIVEKQMSDPVPPREAKPGLPEDLDLLCVDLLNRDPDKRPGPKEILNAINFDKTIPIVSHTTQLTVCTQADIFVGRLEELQALKEAYLETSNGNFAAMVIEGVSGVGKSALIGKFTAGVKFNDSSAVFLKGRCYEHESSPFKAFDGIVESIIRHIRRIPAKEAYDLLPHNADLLLRLFPTLRRSELFSKIPGSKLEIEDAREFRIRSFDAFKEVLYRLGRQHPLVVIIDDMQWADAESLSLLKQLLEDTDTPSMLLILLSRFAKDAEDSVWDWNSVVTRNHKRIQLKPLDEQESTDLARMYVNLAGTAININPKFIADEAAGHPLYIAELVRYIASFEGKQWRSLRLDEVIWNRVSVLPKVTRKLLQTICVAGTPIERAHLQDLTNLKSEDFHKSISSLRASKLIRSRGPKKNDLIEPYHDRVRESVVNHVSATGESARIHLGIGRFFVTIYNDIELEENIFTVVQHLHASSELITDSAEKDRLAELYFLAGKKAKDSAAYASSLLFFKKSIELLSVDRWKTHYDMTFSLYCQAAESAYINGDFSFCDELAKVAMEKATTTLDKARIYETHILSLVANGNPIEAIDKSIDMIKKLGVKLPRRPGKVYVLFKILITKFRLFRKTREQLYNMPNNKVPHIIAARSLMVTTSTAAFYSLRSIWATMILKSVELSLKHGMDRYAAVIFSGWSAINNFFLKRYDDGYDYGRLAMDLLDKFEDSSKKAMTIAVYAAFSQHWKEHIRKTLPLLTKCYDIAYKTGDLTYIALGGALYVKNVFLAGLPLNEIVTQSENYLKDIENKKQDIHYNTNRIYTQTSLNLMGKSKQSARLQGTVYNESEMIPHHIKNNQENNLFEYYSCTLLVNLYFGHNKDAREAGKNADKYKRFTIGTTSCTFAPFYYSLACLRYHSEADSRTKRKLLRQVRKNQTKYKRTAAISPMNHAHKYALVEAERARVKGKTQEALRLYDAAIEGAVKNEFVQDAAIACEFAAEYHREIESRETSQSYARDAVSHYEKWGAIAKVEDVKEKFGL